MGAVSQVELEVKRSPFAVRHTRTNLYHLLNGGDLEYVRVGQIVHHLVFTIGREGIDDVDGGLYVCAVQIFPEVDVRFT